MNDTAALPSRAVSMPERAAQVAAWELFRRVGAQRGMGIEDFVAEARVAIWREEEALRDIEPEMRRWRAHVKVGRCAIVDYLRKRLGAFRGRPDRACAARAAEHEVETAALRRVDTCTPDQIVAAMRAWHEVTAGAIDPRLAVLAQLLASGASQTEIAQRFGVTPSRVCQLAKRLELLLRELL